MGRQDPRCKPCGGLAVYIWDDNGKPARGEKGELVYAKVFSAMPISFWNDPDGKTYHAAYSTLSIMFGA